MHSLENLTKNQWSICIEKLELMVRLGVTKEERSKRQKVFLRIEFSSDHNKILDDMRSDDINNALCYDSLCAEVAQYISEQEFCLIEKMGLDLLDFLKNLYQRYNFLIQIEKMPMIKNLKGSVVFRIKG